MRPNGSEQALPKEAIFVEKRSKSRKAFVTRAAFPNVQVGAILDYRYTFYWDSFYYLEPWYLPRRAADPALRGALRDPALARGAGLGQGNHRAPRSRVEKQQRRSISYLKVWMESLPGLPDEPFSFPDEDLSSRFVLIPTQLYLPGRQPVRCSSRGSRSRRCSGTRSTRATWPATSGREAKAVEIAGAAGKDRRERIRALYEFVRDQVRTGDSTDVWVRDGKADEVLAGGAGSATEKSLLLYTMLDAIKVPARVVWVASRNEGRAELDVPNPAWFDAAILQVDDGGETLSLDPSDRSLAFGRLPPHYESTRAVVVDRKKPEAIVLPASPYDGNSQVATLKLAVDADGKAAGEGTLALAGHHAWRWLRAKETAEETTKLWQEKLAELFPGFEPSAVTVKEDLRGADPRGLFPPRAAGGERAGRRGQPPADPAFRRRPAARAAAQPAADPGAAALRRFRRDPPRADLGRRFRDRLAAQAARPRDRGRHLQAGRQPGRRRPGAPR